MSAGGKSIRNLKELELHEGSVVIFPANDAAYVVGVKAAEATASMDALPDSGVTFSSNAWADESVSRTLWTDVPAPCR